MAEKKQESACYRWCLTIPILNPKKTDQKGVPLATKAKLLEVFKKLCDRYEFQHERGKVDGYEHFQCGVSFKEKVRKPDLLLGVWGVYASRMSNKGERGAFEYGAKDDTRVDGPWSSRDITPPRDLLRVEKLRPWQQHVVNDCKEWCTAGNGRTVNVIVDVMGGNGKSMLKRWMLWKKIAYPIPMFNVSEKMMQCVMARIKESPKENAFIMDIPRTCRDVQKSADIWSAIEQIKDGVCYDWRYKSEQIMFDQPKLWVFTNEMPPKKSLSEDRWCTWLIDPTSNELMEHTAERWAMCQTWAKNTLEDKEEVAKIKKRAAKPSAIDKFDFKTLWPVGRPSVAVQAALDEMKLLNL